jgi:hypothetical protein
LAVAEIQLAGAADAVNSDKSKRLLRLGSMVLVTAGVALLTAYSVRCWPYVHREDFHFTVLSSNGADFVASGCIPLPFTPCLLLGMGAVLWTGSVLAAKRERRVWQRPTVQRSE